MRDRSVWLRTILLATVVCLSAAMAAAQLPRLSKDIELPKGKQSPGLVVFSHLTHVDEAKPDCTVCHPRLFKMLGPGRAAAETITHERMEKGNSCGVCHNGKAAHGLDDCSSCHRQ